MKQSTLNLCRVAQTIEFDEPGTSESKLELIAESVKLNLLMSYIGETSRELVIGKRIR